MRPSHFTLLSACVRAVAGSSFSIPDASSGTYTPSSSFSSSSHNRTTSTSSTPSFSNHSSTSAVDTAASYLRHRFPHAAFRANGDHYTSASNNVTHVYFTQTLHGLDIANAHANVNVRGDGSVLSSGSSTVADEVLARTQKVVRRQQLVDPVDALRAAIETQKYPMTADGATAAGNSAAVGGNAESYVIEGTEGTLSNPKADLVYYATPDGVKLCWKLETDMGKNWMLTFADAQNAGTVHGAIDYVSDATYNVYEFGKVSNPTEGQRTKMTDPFNKDASPKGWQTAGDKTYTTTQGNNGIAQDNPSGGDDYVKNHRPDAGPDEVFDYPYDMNAKDPSSYIDASITQLYYTANMLHDMLEEYGFDEPAGNFEEVDTKAGGKGGDAVQLNAQDGGGDNNANFATPPDGQRPRMNMFLWDIAPGAPRDGAFDETIVVHEYTHGLSTRLTGGPASSTCLDATEAEGMGEGWSDFFATALLIRPGDTRRTEYTMGAWVAGAGIRAYPYSTSTGANPTTYAYLNRDEWSDEPHRIGSIWAEMLFEVLWNLEDRYGYGEDPFPGYPDGSVVPPHGRQLAMKLVVDGLMIQPCKPTFLTARDAIVDADRALTDGENLCELWKGFAKRGLGADAKQGNANIGSGYADGFKLPDDLDCDDDDDNDDNDDNDIAPYDRHPASSRVSANTTDCQASQKVMGY